MAFWAGSALAQKARPAEGLLCKAHHYRKIYKGEEATMSECKRFIFASRDATSFVRRKCAEKIMCFLA